MKEKVERIKNEVGKHFCCQSSGSSREGRGGLYVQNFDGGEVWKRGAKL